MTENWHERLFRIVSFGFADWANSPKMLQMEIRRPWRYRLITWPPMMALIALYGALVLWFAGVLKL